jgi:serine/threonine-protein kinase
MSEPTKKETGASPDGTAPPPTVPTLAYVPPDARATVEQASQGSAEPGGAAPVSPEQAPPQSDWPAVAGYDIVGVLGRGAMGVVYIARQRGLNRLVALKMILAGGHASDKELVRFRTEAEAVARLQHPNIVHIYEVGEQDGRPFFSLEYVDGGSLAGRIAGTPQPPRPAAQLVRQLAGAMDYAHHAGVVHRDLKPANILLQEEGTKHPKETNKDRPDEQSTASRSVGTRDSWSSWSSGGAGAAWSHCTPKISDFGLAKRLEEDAGQTQTGTILGTPSYMAPEQAAGKGKYVGPAADTYALGAILYELLTGRPPFRGESVLDTLEQVRTQEPVPPRLLQPKVPRDLETICLKCLQKEPARRYGAAGDLGEDLRRFLTGEPILARPVSGPERLWRWCRRNPLAAGLGAAVVLLLATVAVTSSGLAWRLKLQKDATEAARQEAVENATRAQDNANAAAAQQKLAETNAGIAKTRHAEAVKQVVGLIEKLDSKLRPQPGTQPDAQSRQLREELRGTAMETLADMAHKVEQAGLGSFGMVLAHQQMGDLFRQHGQVEEAARQYRLGCDLAERIAKEQPDLDQARGNLAFMLAKLGDIALEMDADPRAARDYYGRALATQQDIADHPRNGFYKLLDHKRLLSGYLVKRGTAALQAGDPETARADFLKARALRLEWTAADQKNVSARSFLSEAHFVLGDVQWRLGDAKATHESFGEALRLCEDLVQSFPKSEDFKFDLATVEGAHGDALLRLGQAAEARANYQRSREIIERLAAKDAENVPYQAFQALTYYRLATVLDRLKDPGAAKLYEDALGLRSRLAQADPKNLPYRAELPVTLARCGKRAPALEKAAGLRREAPDKVAVLLPAARAFAVCAAGAGDAAEKKRCAELAVEALRVAAGQGYRDVAALETDPELDPIREERTFQDWLNDLKQH